MNIATWLHLDHKLGVMYTKSDFEDFKFFSMYKYFMQPTPHWWPIAAQSFHDNFQLN